MFSFSLVLVPNNQSLATRRWLAAHIDPSEGVVLVDWESDALIMVHFIDPDLKGALDNMEARRLEQDEMVQRIREHFSHWSRQQEGLFRGLFGEIWEFTLPDGTKLLFARSLNEVTNELIIL